MNKKNMIDFLIQNGIEQTEAKAEVELMLEFKLDKTREELLFTNDFDSKIFQPILEERVKTHRPIQYMLGFAPFMGEKFIVNESVLIPRDETEILVREAFCHIKNNSKILDIGTGSGIIPCMLGILSKKAGFTVEIIGVDISLGALNVAIDNMKKFNLTRTAMFRKSDLFSNINEKFDIIVSNPPYIPKKFKETIQKEVLFEPDIALYTEDNDGLYFYKKIICDAPKFLNKGGTLLFELMEGQALYVERLLAEAGFFDIEIKKDLTGIERTISAKI